MTAGRWERDGVRSDMWVITQGTLGKPRAQTVYKNVWLRVSWKEYLSQLEQLFPPQGTV